ncbi:MAG: 50S ribosomal protein L38e [Candidatus Thorarchaeota archaeon]
MPRQITDVEKFIKMSESAKECRVKRGSNDVKLKLRTEKYLYTIVLAPQEAESVIQRVKCSIVEARKSPETS